MALHHTHSAGNRSNRPALRVCNTGRQLRLELLEDRRVLSPAPFGLTPHASAMISAHPDAPATVAAGTQAAPAAAASSPLSLGFALRLGGSGIDGGGAVATDSAGNVYVAGSMEGTVDFDPGPGTTNLSGDAFVAKYTPSGALVWARTLSGTFGSADGAMTVDAAGNVYITGSFTDTVNFNPGSGTFNLSSPNAYSVFVLKLDASGGFVWACQLAASDSSEGRGITVDKSGNVYVTGAFSESIDLNPGPGVLDVTTRGDWDSFIVKLDGSGNFVWGDRFGGDGDDTAYAVAVDSSGNVYGTGYFNSTANFDPGSGTANLVAGESLTAFVVKLDSGGNYVWAEAFAGSSGASQGCGIAVDSSGNVYTTGNFWGTVDFDPGSGVDNLTASGQSSDVFFSKLDSNGNFVWAGSVGGSSDDGATGIALDSANNVWVTGAFQSSVAFGASNLTSVGVPTPLSPISTAKPALSSGPAAQAAAQTTRGWRLPSIPTIMSTRRAIFKARPTSASAWALRA